MRRLAGFSLCLLAFAFAPQFSSHAAIVQSIPSQDLQGENGLGVIQLPLGHTVNLSFINSGELVRQVHLDDRGKVVISFDSPLCSHTQPSDGCKAGASVIYLRQIKHQLNFDANAVSGYRSDDGNRATALTVITTRLDGSQRKIYNFELQLTTGSRAPRTIEIVGNRPRQRSLGPVANPPLPPENPPSNRATAVARTAQIRAGLAQAYAQNLVALDSPVRPAMAEFFRLIDQGEPFDRAQAQSEIPAEFLDWLQSLTTH